MNLTGHWNQPLCVQC